MKRGCIVEIVLSLVSRGSPQRMKYGDSNNNDKYIYIYIYIYITSAIALATHPTLAAFLGCEPSSSLNHLYSRLGLRRHFPLVFFCDLFYFHNQQALTNTVFPLRSININSLRKNVYYITTTTTLILTLTLTLIAVHARSTRRLGLHRRLPHDRSFLHSSTQNNPQLHTR